MDEFLSEKEQIEQIRKWWSENGRWVIAGVALGVALLVGWNTWRNFVAERAAEASALYDELAAIVEESNPGDATRSRAEDLGRRLKGDYAATPYDEGGALVLARLYVSTGALDEAGAELQYVIDRGTDPELEMVARLRLAQVRLQQQRYDDAEAALAVDSPGAFTARIDELKGDLAYARGDHAAARAAYERALAEGEGGLVNRSYVQMKLDDLAPVEAAGEAADAAAEDDANAAADGDS